MAKLLCTVLYEKSGRKKNYLISDEETLILDLRYRAEKGTDFLNDQRVVIIQGRGEGHELEMWEYQCYFSADEIDTDFGPHERVILFENKVPITLRPLRDRVLHLEIVEE